MNSQKKNRKMIGGAPDDLVKRFEDKDDQYWEIGLVYNGTPSSVVKNIIIIKKGTIARDRVTRSIATQRAMNEEHGVFQSEKGQITIQRFDDNDNNFILKYEELLKQKEDNKRWNKVLTEKTNIELYYESVNSYDPATGAFRHAELSRQRRTNPSYGYSGGQRKKRKSKRSNIKSKRSKRSKRR